MLPALPLEHPGVSCRGRSALISIFAQSIIGGGGRGRRLYRAAQNGEQSRANAASAILMVSPLILPATLAKTCSRRKHTRNRVNAKTANGAREAVAAVLVIDQKRRIRCRPRR